MTTPPFGQPEPFDPARVPMPAARPRPATSRRLLPIAGAVALALIAFGGGYVVANATSTKSGNTAFAGGDGGQGFAPGASFRARNGGGGFGGGASGTIGSVSADQMTITTQAGGSRIVLLTPTTAVTQVTAATKAVTDLTSGETVTVEGTANPDGSVTATRVIIGDVGTLLGGGRGFGGGANASAAPSSAP